MLLIEPPMPPACSEGLLPTDLEALRTTSPLQNTDTHQSMAIRRRLPTTGSDVLPHNLAPEVLLPPFLFLLSLCSQDVPRASQSGHSKRTRVVQCGGEYNRYSEDAQALHIENYCCCWSLLFLESGANLHSRH